MWKQTDKQTYRQTGRREGNIASAHGIALWSIAPGRCFAPEKANGLPYSTRILCMWTCVVMSLHRLQKSLV